MKRLFIGGVVALVFLSTAVSAQRPVRHRRPRRPTTAAPATTAAGDSGRDRGVTATSIKVGGLGYSLLYGGADVGAKARFQRANDAGGVNGRTIDYTGFADDGGNPAATTAARDLAGAATERVRGRPGRHRRLRRGELPRAAEGAVLRVGALVRLLRQPSTASGSAAAQCPKGVTSNAWAALIAKLIGATAAGRAAAILAENTPTGQYEVTSLTAGRRAPSSRSCTARRRSRLPATLDYDGGGERGAREQRGEGARLVFVVGDRPTCSACRTRWPRTGSSACSPTSIEYAPDLVAPAIGAFVMTQTAPTESAPTNPAMAQLVADVQKVAPGSADRPGGDRGVLVRRPLPGRGEEGGQAADGRVPDEGGEQQVHVQVPNTVGPTTFPAAHSVPTPCGALVASNGTAYAVKVPYTCGRLVPVK